MKILQAPIVFPMAFLLDNGDLILNDHNEENTTPFYSWAIVLLHPIDRCNILTFCDHLLTFICW